MRLIPARRSHFDQKGLSDISVTQAHHLRRLCLPKARNSSSGNTISSEARVHHLDRRRLSDDIANFESQPCKQRGFWGAAQLESPCHSGRCPSPESAARSASTGCPAHAPPRGAANPSEPVFPRLMDKFRVPDWQGWQTRCHSSRQSWLRIRCIDANKITIAHQSAHHRNCPD